MVRASASEAEGRGFDPRACHIKDAKMVSVATFLALSIIIQALDYFLQNSCKYNNLIDRNTVIMLK